jgi:hypothetical protein
MKRCYTTTSSLSTRVVSRRSTSESIEARFFSCQSDNGAVLIIASTASRRGVYSSVLCTLTALSCAMINKVECRLKERLKLNASQ